jgi:hypothetical protein
MTMTSTRPALRLLIATACGLAWLTVVQTPRAMGQTVERMGAPGPRAVATGGSGGDAQRGLPGAGAVVPSASATLEQCVTAVTQAERSASFAGEMTAIAGTARMEMRIEVLERMPDEALFHTVSAPGLGVWRGSAPGVKSYTDIKQVTNLTAPAFYRGAVRFRWLNAKGRLIKGVELRTPTCDQTAAPSPTSATAGPAAQSTAG